MGKGEGDRPTEGKAAAQVIEGYTLADAKKGDLPAKTVAAGPTDLQITGADDAKVPATKQERMQEFIDGVGRVNKLYHDTTQSDERVGRFQTRMGDVYNFDHSTFKELARLGEAITGKPPASPEAVGKGLAQVFKNTLDRHQGGNIDYQDPEWVSLMGAMSGMMLATQSTFDPPKDAAQTAKMVDALEAEFQRQKVPFLHGVIYGDTKEPGLAAVPPGETIDRHNFIPKN